MSGTPSGSSPEVLVFFADNANLCFPLVTLEGDELNERRIVFDSANKVFTNNERKVDWAWEGVCIDDAAERLEAIICAPHWAEEHGGVSGWRFNYPAINEFEYRRIPYIV